MEDATVGRWLKAQYDFGGLDREVEKTLPLSPHERVLVAGRVALSRPPTWLPVLGYIRLTPQRLVIVRQRLLGADVVLELRSVAVLGVARNRRTVVLEVAVPEGTQRLRIGTPRRIPLGTPPLRASIDDLAAAITAWRTT